jgi:uncharacterized peroxidase-related enzyme
MRHHRRGLRRLLADDELLARLDEGYLGIGLTARQEAMLGYVVKLTLRPGEMAESDVRLLKDNGHSEVDILQIVQVCCYFNFVNRLADGLGVELEPWFSED